MKYIYEWRIFFTVKNFVIPLQYKEWFEVRFVPTNTKSKAYKAKEKKEQKRKFSLKNYKNAGRDLLQWSRTIHRVYVALLCPDDDRTEQFARELSECVAFKYN